MEILLVIFAVASFGVYKFLTLPMNLMVGPRLMAQFDADMGLGPRLPSGEPPASPYLRDITPPEGQDDPKQRVGFEA